MQDGRVTLIADNVPLRQILQEWARIGQAKIVNGEKLSGPAITLQLIDVSEREALDILLRSASGYIAAPRPVALAGAAMYDRVTIMATSRPPAATANNVAPPTFQRPPMPVDVDDEPINVAMPQPMGIPVNGQFPGMPPPGVRRLAEHAADPVAARPDDIAAARRTAGAAAAARRAEPVSTARDRPRARRRTRRRGRGSQ